MSIELRDLNHNPADECNKCGNRSKISEDKYKYFFFYSHTETKCLYCNDEPRITIQR